jgi:hypothetical protein
MLNLEALRKRLYQLNDHAHFLLSVKLLLRVEAVVACPAVVFCVVLSEIIEEKLSSA